MSGLSVSTILATLRFFADAIQAKRQQRAAIFDRLVLQNFLALEAIHKESHSILLPIIVELRHLTCAVHQECDLVDALNRLDEAVEAARSACFQGKPDRGRLYHECAHFERSRLASRRWRDPISEDDAAAIRSFVASICAYFRTSDAYKHDLGNALNGAALATWNWKTKPPTLADVCFVQSEIRLAERRMSEKWDLACSHFGRLRALIDLNLELDPTCPDETGAPGLLPAVANDCAYREMLLGPLS